MVSFPHSIDLPTEEVVAAAICDLKETGLPISREDLHLDSNEVVSVALVDGKLHHVSIFGASVPFVFVGMHLCTIAKVEAPFRTASNVLEDSYVVPASISIDGQS
jgi:hypothetical protein